MRGACGCAHSCVRRTAGDGREDFTETQNSELKTQNLLRTELRTRREIAVMNRPGRLLLCVCLAAVVAPGCLSRSRLNESCEWVGDAPRALTLQQRAHMEHLVSDVELAEELGLAFALVYVAVSLVLIRTLTKRVGDDLRHLTIALGLAAVVTSGVALACFNMLRVQVAEIIRTGNMHRSLRAASPPWSAHLPALYAAAVFVFAVLALVEGARTRREIAEFRLQISD